MTVPEGVIDQYVDGVVTYNQFRDDLNIGVLEARNHPDTLDAYFDLVEVVKENPELVLAYTGVVKSRGKKRQECRDEVRQIETEIINGLLDVDVITVDEHTDRELALKTDEGLLASVVSFEKVFRPLIPADQRITKKSSKKPSRRTNAAKTSEAIVEQDSVFNLILDENGDLSVNQKVPDLDEVESVIFKKLVSEGLLDDHLVGPSVIKHTSAWQRVVGTDRQKSGLVFSRKIRSLQQKLEKIGLGKLIEKEGTTPFNTGYRMRIDSYEDLRPLPSKTDKRSEHEEITAASFTKRLLEAVEEVEKTETELGKGIRTKHLAMLISRGLGITHDEGETLIQSLRDEELLFTRRTSGSVYLTVKEPVLKREAQNGSRARSVDCEGKTKQNVWTKDVVDVAKDAFDALLELVDVNQSIPLKKLWADSALSDTMSEQEYKRAARLVQSRGYLVIEKKKPSGGGRKKSRYDTLTVRFPNNELRTRLKTNRKKIIDELNALVVNESQEI